jgi:diguanylate cyclase (GGDEF)-like protein
VFSDISPIKKTQQKLDFLAHHDPLTELPNRLLLNDRMQHAIDHASREKKGVAVMFLDLDRFKNINDSLGHPVGDSLLQEVATRLRSTLREVDSISRQGGDEFVMVLEDIENPDSVVATARKILQLFEYPFMVSGREMIITASLGISLYPEDGDDVTTLIRNADAAMYRAKENGRNRFWFYTEDITRHAALRVDMEQALRDTVNHGELVLHYQPQIDLKTLQVVGVEALLRWDRPGHGLVMPDTFIPLAEETGVIDAIGEWVIYSACRQMKHWQERGAQLTRMAINISPVQISHGNLVAVIEAALNATGLAPEHLELEVTEAIFLRDTDKAARVLRELDEFGVRLALDDFGTGFSSLSYLKNFHFDRLKIDRSFIQEALDKSSDRSIANSVIALGHSLGMVVVAEGIEVEEQLSWLQEKGCDEGQGYFFSKPVSAEEIVQLLNY